MEKIVVTGGAGFIGCNLADQFAEKAKSIVLLDNFSRRGGKANVEWLKSRHDNIEVVEADITKDQEKLNETVKGADAIYHFAAQVAVTTSVADPRSDFLDNALGTFNVLEAVRQNADNAALFYSSTNKVYGGMEQVETVERNSRYEYKDFAKGIPETMVLDFHSPYGCSKGAADQYVRDYARIYGLKTAVFRQSCIYGQRQFGIEDQGWVAWFTIASALDKQLTIFGDGKQIRDILHVDDLIRAYGLATEQIEKVKGQIFNIGGGAENTMSLLELLAFLEEFFGKKIDVKHGDWRPGDQPVYVSDISKAKEVFGWAPKIGVKDGVKKLYDWVLENKEMFEDLEAK
ncbi:MAG: CDP-paratose 2-epimerase [Candidatus Diapherotrites archaeon]|uniref:CDP-paratose 2-epimerase n=1 Tax=Candidatus Iainarchaeum sp. TaxID=3101447 RepID=A0A2D6M010_9ARCH|nr:CDP-paratose 2-epimerase [Candidatus Diapherotrites archaeon]